MVLPWIFYQEIIARGRKLSESEFLTIKQFDGKLIKEISAEFTGNGVQITRTPASGKTFYFLKARLYPVVNSIVTGSAGNTPVTSNRRADVEIKLDGTVIDVLTHDMETTFGSAESAAARAEGNAGQAGQYESLIVDSMDGNAIKKIELTSTNVVGTYRVSLIGIEENTGTSPQIPSI